MKIKKEWDLILLIQGVLVVYSLVALISNNQNKIINLVSLLGGLAFAGYEWLRQNRIHNKLYKKISEGSLLPLIFKNELIPIDTSEVWAYYNLDGLDIGIKLPIGTDYSNQSLNPNTLIEDINNYKIHLRG